MTTPQKHYPEVEANPDFPKIEEQVLARWKKDLTFAASIAQRPANKDGVNNEFIFYDGPPFANGLPHYGHLLTSFVKDIYARYHTMRGQRVERRFGWDCHGLPAEMGAEKDLGIEGRQAIMKYGIGKFNDYCRTSVMKYTHEWEYYVTRAARWVDFRNDYKTMDKSYMESVLWAFKQLYDKGLIYEAYRVMPYSWAAETPLSNFETRLDNSYRERVDKAVTVAFELKKKPAVAPLGYDHYRLLAWTTTPWTLPSNLALAVSRNVKYICAAKDNVCYITSLASLAGFAQQMQLVDTVITEESFPGDELLGLTYEPLFPYFRHHPQSFRVLDGTDFVTDGDGTGIVHMAPGFGEEDQRVCEAAGIELVCPVDHAGRFTAEVFDIEFDSGAPVTDKTPKDAKILSLKGMNVLEENVGKYRFGEANERIIEWLKSHGRLLKQEQITHNYPHCWRTDKPLIYRAVPSWYVEVTKFRDRMVELNQQINWIPNHIRDGLFGKWLENARDWSISRNRFWGTPIPIWKSRTGKIKVYGSIAELEKASGRSVPDLHRPYIDDIVIHEDGEEYRRVEDVFDCWFESGSMPYAQVHYPFQNKEWFETHFPADFITEYVAQTRGWFYTLMVLSTALFDRPPFKNCICHGVVIDEETGLKYSKRLKNYKDPKWVFDTFGADALRWLMLASPVMRGLDLSVDPEGKFIRDVVRLAIKPIWNAYNFFCLYANADGMKASLLLEDGKWRVPENGMDRYILSKLALTMGSVQVSLDAYDTPSATATILEFFEALNNWYIRRSKPRFWKSEKDGDKQMAYDTLYTALHIMLRIAAPLLPLVTDEMFAGLTGEAKASVHLTDWPDCDNVSSILNAEIVEAMDRVRDICNAALGIRSARNLRVRLPLAKLTLVTQSQGFDAAYTAIIQEEVNVKEVAVSKHFDEVAALKLQINFPLLGKRLPDKIKKIIPAAKRGDWKRIDGGRVAVDGEQLEPGEFTVLLEPKEKYKQSAQALPTNDALVILDTVVTPELQAEGYARDLVRLIQQARKDAGLQMTDRINLRLRVSGELEEALAQHRDYIAAQVLAASLTTGDMHGCTYIANETIENEEVSIGFSARAEAA